MNDWIPVTDISDIPENGYVLFTVCYECEDACYLFVKPGYRQDVNVPSARIVVEQGVGNMPDIEKRLEADSDGHDACTIRILAYMEYPKAYIPDGGILINE